MFAKQSCGVSFSLIIWKYNSSLFLSNLTNQLINLKSNHLNNNEDLFECLARLTSF